MAPAPEAEAPVVLHAWSTPRSLSTSLMYSFAQRDDMEVLDEPLYANFLQVTGVERPYREELLSKMEPDGNKVVKDVVFGPGGKRYRYCKHLSKQRLPGLSNDLMKKGKHFILIRNPLNILTSFSKVVPPSFMELGIGELVSIYSELCQFGSPPPVIDADDLLQDPKAVLSGLCEDLGIPFQPQMLKWEAGPRDFDGIWAPWWYGTVHKSTGFSKSRHYPLTFPFAFYELLEQALPVYNMLKRQVRRTVGSVEAHLPDPPIPVPANKKILVWIGDELLPRDSAKVSVFDSVVQGGDAVWEGLRIYDGKAFKLDEHLDRLFDSAKAMAFINIPTRDWIKDAIFKTLIANGMFDNAHIRLTLTRGKKGVDGDVGPSSSVSTATPPNGRNGRLLTPTSDDGEYVEYSFDSLSDMPYTVEDEDRMLMRAILESLKDLEQSNTKTVQSTASENVQSAASDAASKENNVVKDCNGVNDVTSGPDVQSMSACVTRISDNHTTDYSDEANASEMQSEQNGSVNGTAPVRASEPQASTQITSEKTALVEPHKPTQNVRMAQERLW